MKSKDTTAFVVMDGIPNFNGIPFKSYQQAVNYAKACNKRSDLVKARVVRLRHKP